VADFGLASNGTEVWGKEQEIPWRWTAPEVFEHDYWCQSSDVWAFGVTIWEVFTNALIPFFEITDDEDLKKHVFRDRFRLNQPAQCPNGVFEIMSRCWEHDHMARPSFVDLAQELQDASATHLHDGPLIVM